MRGGPTSPAEAAGEPRVAAAIQVTSPLAVPCTLETCQTTQRLTLIL